MCAMTIQPVGARLEVSFVQNARNVQTADARRRPAAVQFAGQPPQKQPATLLLGKTILLVDGDTTTRQTQSMLLPVYAPTAKITEAVGAGQMRQQVAAASPDLVVIGDRFSDGSVPSDLAAELLAGGLKPEQLLFYNDMPPSGQLADQVISYSRDYIQVGGAQVPQLRKTDGRQTDLIDVLCQRQFSVNQANAS